jgi:rRNA-processing protein FCF1
MGYKFPAPSLERAVTSPTLAQAVANSYQPYASYKRAETTQLANNGGQSGGLISIPTVSSSYGNISLSHFGPRVQCGYCRKDHVCYPGYDVINPATKAVIHTCSSECNTRLLKSMMANLHPTPPLTSSVVSAPVSMVPTPTFPSATLSGYMNPAPNTTSTMISPTYGQINQHQPSGYVPGPSQTYSSYPTPTNAAWTHPPPHFPPNPLTSAPLSSQGPHWPPASSTSPYPAPTASHPSYTHDVYHNNVGRSHSTQPAPHQPHHPTFGTQKISHSPQAKMSSSRSHDTPAQHSIHPHAAPSSTHHAAQRHEETASHSKRSLASQLRHWVDKRDHLPPFWQVTTIILDTNVLLDEKEPDAVLRLHRDSSKVKFIVPYVLIQELDKLKARMRGPHHAARIAISQLFEMLVHGSKKEKWIRGQKPDERLPLEGTLMTTSGDDRILECANYFHRYSPKGQKAMLLTHDKNLQLKATMLGMVTGGVQNMHTFFDNYQWLEKERDVLKTQIKLAEQRGEIVKVVPDWRLEDYEPSVEEEEEDVFKKMKREAEMTAKLAVEEGDKKVVSDQQAQILASQRADALARLPSGTRIDIYDDSDSEPIQLDKKAVSNALSESEDFSTSESAASSKKARRRARKAKQKQEEAKRKEAATKQASPSKSQSNGAAMEVDESKLSKQKTEKKQRKPKEGKKEKMEPKEKKKQNTESDQSNQKKRKRVHIDSSVEKDVEESKPELKKLPPPPPNSKSKSKMSASTAPPAPNKTSSAIPALPVVVRSKSNDVVIIDD